MQNLVVLRLISLLLASLVHAVTFQPLSEQPGLIDNGTFGPEVEVVHLFFNEPPIGLAVGPTGRAFVTHGRGNLTQSPITFGEIVNASVEVPFPNAEFNIPPDGLTNSSSGRLLSSSDSTHFINAQAAVHDAKGRLWVLDSGRPSPGGDITLGVPGGPKLMGFDVANNATTPFTTITFTEDVLPSLGYLNDLRIDLTTSLTKSGKGVVYLADSGAAAIIVVDLGTGKSWRHLSGLHSTSPNPTQLPTLFGVPTYIASPKNPAYHYETVAGGGIDGFAISADGQFIYYTPFASRDLYRVPTAALLLNPADDNLAFLKSADSVQHLGQIGGQANGLETDTTGKIYVSSPEHNSINMFDPETGMISPFVRSPILAWPDTLTVANDGFIYATLNQLWLSPGFQNGTDKRVKPFTLVRVPIEGKPVLLG
ncbi:NHL repeat-containing protein [Stereum hirsutum FP-91666 SS1]|uniref:NHL repeat-containing protein n=1 Tax=Stereum hirsutum (strain FP-91666) TaxID=721885 RepID=UPI0004449330|nr:NHL repeat-containing protein [Stereum hirsutum FP-91666 SS1]EIM83584.1 NHL repeat-containing protein [Stereum hirsutum FP-91666 SS1]